MREVQHSTPGDRSRAGPLSRAHGPESIALVKADIELLEESLVGVIAKHHPTAK